MENVDSAASMSSSNKTAPQLSSSSASVPSLSSQILIGHHDHVHRVVVSPCAACKILRRRCVDNCVLAPYFPPNDPLKFTTAHRVFGASNIIKFLQELPENQRADAVSSMVYEANARLRDPVYGCAGAISQLQKEVNELQAQLAQAHAEVATIQYQQANLAALLCTEMAQSQHQLLTLPQDYGSYINVDMIQDYHFDDLGNLGSLWEPSHVDMI